MAIANPYVKDLRRIWVGAKTLGLDEDVVHLLLENVTGKKSLKETTPTERAKLIEELRKKGAYHYKRSQKPEAGSKGPGTRSQKPETRNLSSDLISPDQRFYIHDLFIHLAATAPDFGSLAYQQGFIKKILGESRFWPQTRGEASKIIEALKQRVKQAEKRQDAKEEGIIHEENEGH